MSTTQRLTLTLVAASGVGRHATSNEAPQAADIVCEVCCGEHTARTNAKKANTEDWGHEVKFDVEKGLGDTAKLSLFAVDDDDDGKDELVGEAVLELSTLMPKEKTQMELPVLAPGTSDAAGQLIVDVLYDPEYVEVEEKKTRTSSGTALPSLAPSKPDVVSSPAKTPATATPPASELLLSPKATAAVKSAAVGSPSKTPLSPKTTPAAKAKAVESPSKAPRTSLARSTPLSPSAKAAVKSALSVSPSDASATAEEEKAEAAAVVVPSDPPLTAKPPNFLIVTILEARNLIARDGTGENATSDAFVKLSCTKNKPQRTKVIRESLHPKWRQRFFFRLTPTRQVLDLVLEDEDMITNDFLGQCSIDIEHWMTHFNQDKVVMWIALEPRKAPGDVSVSDISPERNMNYGHGKICIAIETRHIERSLDSLEQGEQDNVTIVPSSKSSKHTTGMTGDNGEDESGGRADGGEGEVFEVQGGEQNEGGGNEEDAAEEDDEDDESVTKETEEDIKKREEEREKMFTELSNVQFLSGDYQIQVRIIEVRDLKPMDVNGLCDPVVSVECLTQRQHTSVKQQQLSCVFDEYLYFNFKNLDRDTAQQGSIKITVLDADGPGSLATSNMSAIARICSNTIGFFTVDIPYVYFQKDHEIHRKWVALVGSGKDNSDLIQGYLLLSIVVLGPGDKLKIHSPYEDKEAQSSDVLSKNDINSLVLIPPRVIQTLNYLVVTIYQAKDLPDMDQNMLKRGGIDAYAVVKFAGDEALETKKITVKGSNHLTVEFNQELWFPVLLPCMANLISISLWDWDLTMDELVGNSSPYLFSQVQNHPTLFEPHWTNLYGPPIGYTDATAERKFMFSHPKLASTYRGRMLVSLRVEDGSKSVTDRPHTRNLTAALPLPPTKSYTLRTAIFFGTEIPRFVSKMRWNYNSKMSLKISIGRYQVSSSRVDNIKGLCHWNQYLEISDVKLPADLEHVPDVFIHLVRQQLNETRYICYARFSARELFQSVDSSPDELKTIPSPRWVSLLEDPVMDDLKDHDFTGNVLMNIRLEATQPNIIANELAQRWREHAISSQSYTKYTLFVHVFQGRALPAADSNGALDPYIKVTCGGAEGKVSARMATRDPCYYETVSLDVELPQDRAFLPMVSTQVFDWDQWDADDYVGSAKFSLNDIPVLTSSDYNKKRSNGEYSPPRPKWYPICYAKEGDTDGELLLSFELIRKDTPGIVIDPPESIRPPMMDQFLEIVVLGCRGLQPVGFMPVNSPFIKFEVGEITKKDGMRYTNPSSKPSGRNPNYLERILLPIKVPVDALYAPRLNISVFDQLLGGFYKPLLGICSVDLSTKMPMSNGKRNPLYKAIRIEDFCGNPYLDKPIDFSTFPGTLPSSIVKENDEAIAIMSSGRGSRGSRASEEIKPDEDTGAGIVPLMSSLSTPIEEDYTDDGDDDTPHYLRGRLLLDGSLEDELNTAPFESYPLFRGDMLVRKKFFGGASTPDFRSVGRFKGMIRLVKTKDEPPLFDLDQFLTPQPYLIRVYVLDAQRLQPKDENNNCDPYVRISLGDGRKRHHMINDRENHKKETTTPKFHTMYELKAELPGASELRLEVLDYDFFAMPTIPKGISNGITSVGTTVGGDDFIGATLIDLEDRWFSAKWQQLGASGDRYEKRKPLELRPLYAPFSALPQGQLRLWVDILTAPEVKICKPLDISLPPPRQFEVRVIVYRAKNITPGDVFTDLSDLFVKCWLQSRDDKAQTTDTHWRARDGKASFNWRMKFPLELPIDEDNEADKGYLHLQLWDKDLLYDDCLADTVVDLSVFLKQAYKANDIVNVFAKKKQVRIRGATSSQPRSGQPDYSSMHSAEVCAPPNSDSVVISVGEDLRRPLLGEVPMYSSGAEQSATLMVSESHGANGANGTNGSLPRSQPHQKKSSDKHKESARTLVQSFKQRFGMGDDPEDASWLTFTTRDPATGDRVRAGELLVSVEILPVAVADARAAGLGRSEPNNFPFLAEPADRLHLAAMWNPLYVLEALMGPSVYRAFTSCVLCASIIALFIFAGPLVNVFVTFLELVPEPYGWVVFGIALALVIGSFWYFLYRCRRAVASISTK
ncbi:hypothetical protein Poli38472_007030 [Pythium oligandrum]|uniref:C2 domain-containing protein n=1 Tax=Pythium oligandrum TaxID=41045 RepID=A0A8K1C9C4_PYTOL|nr:hypothetical protein Poli38472_007030 [Pythium oligandrum]|eukprot:TMW58885.1 hypothetical protein Poli38472_007030 [Pythium oligandrum]